MKLFFIFACLILFIDINSANDSAKCDLFKKTLGQFKKAITFVSNDWTQVNLDGLFGLKISDDILNSINVNRIKRFCPHHESSKLIKTFKKYHQELRLISLLISKEVNRKTPSYAKHFRFLMVESFYTESMKSLPNNLRHNSFSGYVEDKQESDFDEKLMDYCYFMAYYRCKTPKMCQQLLFNHPKSWGYLLTHEILYFVIYEKRKCYAVNGSVVINRDELNRNVTLAASRLFAEVKKEMANGGDFEDSEWKDIILEQIMIGGGMLGYQEFMRIDWFKTLASWQRENGCFGTNKPENKHRRRLLSDETMKDLCSSHTTGLGTSILSLFLKFLLNF